MHKESYENNDIDIIYNGYFISPFENRALIVIADRLSSGEWVYSRNVMRHFC
jgi:hypothetical protein